MGRGGLVCTAGARLQRRGEKPRGRLWAVTSPLHKSETTRNPTRTISGAGMKGWKEETNDRTGSALPANRGPSNESWPVALALLGWNALARPLAPLQIKVMRTLCLGNSVVLGWEGGQALTCAISAFLARLAPAHDLIETLGRRAYWSIEWPIGWRRGTRERSERKTKERGAKSFGRRRKIGGQSAGIYTPPFLPTTLRDTSELDQTQALNSTHTHKYYC